MRLALIIAATLLAGCSPNAQYRIACSSGDASACQALRDGTAPPPFWGPGGTLIDSNASTPAGNAAAVDFGAKMLNPQQTAPTTPMNCQTVRQGVFLNTTCQ